MSDLKDSELRALTFLEGNGGAVLISRIPEKNSLDEFGNVEPGIAVYKRLEKAGLLIITEEEPVLFNGYDEPFTFTPMVEITDAGREALGSNVEFKP